ncbi:MAG: hypothetical protein Q9213_000986 [Squamulea squamosa]
MSEAPLDLFAELPNELLESIIQYSAHADLPAIRLVSRRCKDIATHYLFTRIITRTDRTAEQISQCPINLFWQQIQELRVSVIEWSDVDRDAIRNNNEQIQSTLRFFHDRLHQDQARTRYTRLTEKHHTDLDARTCPGYLRPVLSMNSLRKVLLTNGSFNPHASLQGECGVLRCTHQNPSSSTVATPGFTTLHFQLLMLALSQKDVPIIELIVKGGHASFFVLTVESFLKIPSSPTSSWPFRQTLVVFRHLTKLHLDLDVSIEHSPCDYYREHLDTSGALSQSLQQAIKLEHLSINLFVHVSKMWLPHRSLGTIFDRCVFPELKTCILSGFTCNNIVLLRFLVGSPKLEELCIDWCVLVPPGTWEEVADGLKEKLTALTDVQLTGIYGSLGSDDHDDNFDAGSGMYDTGSYDNNYGLVQDFFSHGGLNPFGADGRRLEWRCEMRNAKKAVIPGWFERMKKHHGYEDDS